MLTPSYPEIEHWQETSTEVRPVLLLMAYECMPDAESEAYAGWERVLQAAREFDVHAIVSAESFAAIERHGDANEIPGVHFHTPKQDALYRVLRHAPNLFPHNNIAYHHWQRLAYRLARELHRKHCFSLVHQINVCTFREPGYTWRLGIPYVWGPMGGTQNFPVAFLAGMPLAEQIAERAHNIGNLLSLRKHRVKSAAKRASVLLAANSANKSDFERAFRRRVELLPDTAIDAVRRPETAKFRTRGPLNILWRGESSTRKALPLLLEALANLGHDVEYQLHILGDGPLDMDGEALAAKLGVVRRCTFLGDQRMSDVLEQLEWAHLFVSTSLRDTSDKMVLEALGHGVPVMCFGHQSAGDIVTPSCGIRIPVTHPGHAIAAMASSIRSLAKDRTRLLQLSAGACDRARNYLWSENAARITSIYRGLVLAGQGRAVL
jgi:glycosyltransferase involved in cell wall biosynthesis